MYTDITDNAYPISYFGEQFWSQRDWSGVIRFLLRRSSSNCDLFGVVNARKVLRLQQYVVACHYTRHAITASIQPGPSLRENDYLGPIDVRYVTTSDHNLLLASY